jgi:hypothetical protein
MIKVNGCCIIPADEKRGIVNVSKEYLSHEGLAQRQTENTLRENDFINEKRSRISFDNGKTWSAWQDATGGEISTYYGDDEMVQADTPRLWNSVHKHYVYTHWTRFFIGGHEVSYKEYWNEGKRTSYSHQYISVARDGMSAPFSTKLVKYEEGEDFSAEDPTNPDYLYKNYGSFNAPTVLECGDIAVPVGAHVDKLCDMFGIDVESFFPSCPEIHRGVIVARGKYNEASREYNFTFSNPVMLSDLQSSRGIDEPIIVELKSGRLILVMRGSNVRSEKWRTRIKEGTPTYKWYSYSDDGGKTFTEPVPWMFDTEEPIYSAATISSFIRSSKTGKLYWVGNISDETAYGNYPRYPLYIAEVDDESGLLKKDTLTVIDTRREDEPKEIQFSNFCLVEDRESLDIEIYLAKVAQFDAKKPFFGESRKYVITV